jgi:hypothetical protein
MAYPTCDFNIEKVRDFYKKSLPKNEWLKYLRFVLEKYKETDEFGADKSGFGQKVYSDILIIGSEVGDSSGSVKSDFEGFEKIKWNGSLLQLVYLFNRLLDENILDSLTFKSKKWLLISKIFLDKSGSNITPGILKETEAFLERKVEIKNDAKIDNIVDGTKEVK